MLAGEDCEQNLIGTIEDTMNDPHVSWLEYELQSGWAFECPPPQPWTTPVFNAILDKGRLCVDLVEHYEAIEDARKAVEQYLWSWEIDVALSCGNREFVFNFRDGKVIDREPSPPGTEVVGTVDCVLEDVKCVATGTCTLKSYPAPPTTFEANPDVRTLWNRYEGYRNGREPLAAMAYFCLTVLEWRFGGRGKASKKLGVDPQVLRWVGELSTERGDNNIARKMTANVTPFAAKEKKWLDAATRALIRRAGEIHSGNAAPRLTMKDLPPL